MNESSVIHAKNLTIREKSGTLHHLAATSYTITDEVEDVDDLAVIAHDGDQELLRLRFEDVASIYWEREEFA